MKLIGITGAGWNLLSQKSPPAEDLLAIIQCPICFSYELMSNIKIRSVNLMSALAASVSTGFWGFSKDVLEK